MTDNNKITQLTTGCVASVNKDALIHSGSYPLLVLLYQNGRKERLRRVTMNRQQGVQESLLDEVSSAAATGPVVMHVDFRQATRKCSAYDRIVFTVNISILFFYSSLYPIFSHYTATQLNSCSQRCIR